MQAQWKAAALAENYHQDLFKSAFKHDEEIIGKRKEQKILKTIFDYEKTLYKQYINSCWRKCDITTGKNSFSAH